MAVTTPLHQNLPTPIALIQVLDTGTGCRRPTWLEGDTHNHAHLLQVTVSVSSTPCSASIPSGPCLLGKGHGSATCQGASRHGSCLFLSLAAAAVRVMLTPSAAGPLASEDGLPHFKQPGAALRHFSAEVARQGLNASTLRRLLPTG